MKEYSGNLSVTKLINLIKTEFSKLSKVASSGSYNDLSNKPTIPAASQTINATLAVASWSGDGPYTYNVPASGVTTSSNGVIGLATSATDAQADAAALADIRITAVAANKITLTARGVKPTVAIPVAIILA